MDDDEDTEDDDNDAADDANTEGDEGFGEDFDDFEAGAENDDFGDFDNGFEESSVPGKDPEPELIPPAIQSVPPSTFPFVSKSIQYMKIIYPRLYCSSLRYI